MSISLKLKSQSIRDPVTLAWNFFECSSREKVWPKSHKNELNIFQGICGSFPAQLYKQ
jgi:hypothetical protein